MIDGLSLADTARLTDAERRQLGHDLRRSVPRHAHAAWMPPSGRADPVTVLAGANAGLIAELLPVRYARMQGDAFAFLRGSAALMAADLATCPTTGLRVQACGDAHLGNFGAHASPEGTPVFDVNDFDETLPAAFEWDVKRLATSLVVAGRVRGLPDRAARALARRAARAYRLQMLALSALPPLAAWRSRIDLEHAIDDIGDRDVRRRERVQLAAVMAANRDAYSHLVSADGLALKLREKPPLLYRLPEQEALAHGVFAGYLHSLPVEQRAVVERYTLRDVAFKVVGVGSVGTFCAIGLFATADGHALLLQLKEARRSVLAPYAGESVLSHQGQRVVSGQRLMQASADVFLGWAEQPLGPRQFYVRQLKDPRLAAISGRIEADVLRPTAQLSGRTLARAHTRTGDSAWIAGYLGDGDAFDLAIADFAVAYADQTWADYQVFCTAIRSGRLTAGSGR